MKKKYLGYKILSSFVMLAMMVLMVFPGPVLAEGEEPPVEETPAVEETEVTAEEIPTGEVPPESTPTPEVTPTAEETEVTAEEIPTGEVPPESTPTPEVTLTEETSEALFSIELLEPIVDVTVIQGDLLRIVWKDEDSLENALINLAYDSDNDPMNGSGHTLLASGIEEDFDGDGDAFTWDTSEVPAGSYFIWAKINNSLNAPVYDILPYVVTVEEAVFVPFDQAQEEPPRIEASITYEWIILWGFSDCLAVDLTIEGTPYPPFIDEWGGCMFDCNQYGIDLQPGMFITATEGQITKELTLENISLDVFDVDNNTMAGTAPPFAWVRADFHDNLIGEGYGIEVQANSNGDWFADFGAEGFDLHPDMWQGVFMIDEDNDQTIAELPEPPEVEPEQDDKHIIAHAQSENEDQIDGYDWEIGSTVSLEIDNPSNGVGVDYADSQVAHETEVEHITISFWLGYDWNLQPGQIITFYDGETTETHVVQSQEITSINVDTEVISGIAVPGTDVMVWFENPSNHEIVVSADGNGLWSADFSGIADIAYGTWGAAAQNDNPDSASHTRYNWSFEHTHIEASLIHKGIGVYQFSPFDTVTLDIYDSFGGEHQHTEALVTNEHGDAFFENIEIVDLHPGTFITARDEATHLVKELEMRFLTLDMYDPGADLVAGTADPGQEIQVSVYDDPNSTEYQMWVTADPDGNWSVTFSEDLTEEMWPAARIYDAELDETSAELEYIEPPSIQGNLTHNWVGLEKFAADTQVSIVIDGSPFNLTTDGDGNGWLDGGETGLDLIVGTTIIATQGETVKELTLEDISLDVFDVEYDLVEGTAPAETWLFVNVHDELINEGYGMDVQADPDGNWTADFDTGGVDLHEDMGAQAMLFDDDGDATVAELPPEPRQPFIVAITDREQVFAAFWPMGETVDLCLDYGPVPDGICDHTATETIYEAPWGWPIAYFELDGIHDLAADDVVTVSGLVDEEPISKTLVVTYLEVTDVDIDTDTVSGYADVDRKIRVISFGDPGIDFEVGSDGLTGYWSAYVGDLLDIIPGTGGLVNDENDEDGDYTEVSWLAVENTPPEIIEITAPLDPVQAGTAVEVTVTFTDPDTNDTHEAKIDWGDENSTEGVVDGYTITGSYTYDTPGVYTLLVYVRDDKDASDEEVYQYVVVYDPEGGFVTGGGWIDSPEGAYAPDASLAGKATFGFVSKYKKGADVPTGVTEFRLKVAELNFHSNTYDWLVVAGKKAMYKGVGTINGEGNYAFMLSCVDGDLQGGDGIDRFRIKIWDKDTDTVIYDNQMGEVEDAEPATALGGGSIVIHKKQQE